MEPLERWRDYGEKPDYAGLLSFGGAPYTQDPAQLEHADVAIVGAPTDDLVSDRRGTRLGPRAIRAASGPPGRHLEAGIDAFEVLRIVDFGDAPVVPADAERSHAAIEETIRAVLAADGIPLVHRVGGHGDRGRPWPHRPRPFRYAHRHRHARLRRRALARHADVPAGRSGWIDPARYVQLGLRGYWPGESEFAWQRDRGITSFFMHDVRREGIEPLIERTLEIVGEGPVFQTVDVDVLDPAFAPGTGTPEPGGMTPLELLPSVRRIADELELVGADIVEVIPTAPGSADTTALVADRIVREILTGLALRKRRG